MDHLGELENLKLVQKHILIAHFNHGILQLVHMLIFQEKILFLVHIQLHQQQFKSNALYYG